MTSGWYKFPLELRWMIFGHVRESGSAQPWRSKVPSSPQLPLVCREWHDFFPHDNFRFLVLNQDRLDDFDRFVSRNIPRRAHVEYIILRVRLPEYDCTVCEQREDDETALKNDIIFVETLQRFFALLSTWQAAAHCYGVHLDIGAYSPSDGQHGFRDARFSREYTHGAGQEVYERHHMAKTIPDDSDTCPAWQRAREGRQPRMGAKRRLLATLGDRTAHLFNNCQILFAATPIIRTLDIRRHYYRHISENFLCQILRQALPNLVSFRSETWVHPEDHTQGQFRHEHFAMLAALPDTVKHVNLYYQSSSNLRPSNCSDWRFRVWRDDLSRDVANAATGLRVLTACFLIDASDFINYSIFDDLHFPDLEYLIMTSQKLQKSQDAALFIAQLVRAGTLIYERMPKLGMMEIVNVHKTDIFFIRFICFPDRTTLIQWGSSWHGEGDLDPLFRKLHRRLQLFHPGKRLGAYRLEVEDEIRKIEQWHPWALRPESRRQLMYDSPKP
jgi:uncharacterized protein DUF6546